MIQYPTKRRRDRQQVSHAQKPPKLLIKTLFKQFRNKVF